MKPTFSALIIGDEILSGKREDKHLSKLIAILADRGLSLAYANYVGDDPDRITATIAKGPRAGMLKVSEGSPLLRTEAINVDRDGAPIEYGLSWFVGDRVALTVANDGH